MMHNAAAPVNYITYPRQREYEESNGYVAEMRDLETRLIHAVQAQNDAATLENLRILYQCAAASKFLQRQEMSGPLYSETISQQLK